MPMFWNLIQYEPDGGRQERINVGILVYEYRGGFVYSVLKDWTRVGVFAGKDPAPVKEALEDMLDNFTFPAFFDQDPLLFGGWHSFRFGERRASIRQGSMDDLKDFLHDRLVEFDKGD